MMRAALIGLSDARPLRAAAARRSISPRASRWSTSTSGWFDVGVVDGKNKLVPSITFKLKNVSDQTLDVLQVNVLFRRVGDPSEWGGGFRKVAGSEGLAPGATSEPSSTSTPSCGYTGTEARADMLKNPQFVDAEVEIFAKYGSDAVEAIGDFPISRQLLTR